MTKYSPVTYDAAVIPEANDFPVMLDVELSAKCNLRCSFCHLNWFTLEKIDQFDTAMFETHIVPALSRIKALTLFRNYEPLTCRDFVPIMRRIAEFELEETYFSSNGLLLREDNTDAIVGNLTYLTISVNGFTRDSYHANMGIDGLDKVKEKIARLNALKKERGTRYPILRFSVVGKQDALTELRQAVDFADEFEAEEGIRVIPFQTMDDSQEDQRPVADRSAYDQATEDAVGYAEKKGVKLALMAGDFDENEAETERLGHRFCRIPWNRLSIDPNGDVFPCNVANEVIGNLFEENIEQIWHGPRMQSFRAGVNNPDAMNKDCQTCPHCRLGSMTQDDATNFNKSDTYIGGLKRFHEGPARKVRGKAPA
jgi:radical SAM protein with 4Fe4S-binding SPASM domain